MATFSLAVHSKDAITVRAQLILDTAETQQDMRCSSSPLDANSPVGDAYTKAMGGRHSQAGGARKVLLEEVTPAKGDWELDRGKGCKWSNSV